MGIPTALSQRVRAGHAVLVAGLGFFDPPSARGWVPMLRRLAEKLGNDGARGRDSARGVLDLINRGRLADALSFLRQQLPDEVLRQVIADVSVIPGASSPAVEQAARWPFRGVINTSFDDAWERAWRGRGGRRLLARQLADGARLDEGAAPFLLSALGTLGDPETLCLSPGDLRRRPLPAAVAGFLRGLFADRTFVFAGFRPGDPDLRLVLEAMLGGAPSKGDHYFVQHEANLAPDSELDAGVLGAGLDVVPVRWGGSLEEFFAALGRADVDGVAGSSASDGGTTVPRFQMPESRATPAVNGGAGATGSAPAPGVGVINGISRGDKGSGPHLSAGSPGMASSPEWIREQHAAITAAPVPERPVLFERAGDVCRERLRNPVQAISYYRSALAIEPGRRSALSKLADLYAKHRHFPAAEEILVRLAQTEPPGEGRARLLRQAAAIANDELDRPARAAQLLDKALDEAPTEVETFEALERLFNQEKNWQSLARLYQKMARELDSDGPGRPVKLRAMDGLADLALRFSKDPRVALKALEAADVLDPANIDRKALMAGLYQQVGPSEFPRAAALHHATIAADPERFGSYRALAELYRATGELDRLWCVASTLSFLRKADDDLREVFERGRAKHGGSPPQPLSPEVWSRIAHPDEDRDFGALFALLGPILLSAHAVLPEHLALRPDERLPDLSGPVAAADAPVLRAIAAARRYFDVPGLEIYGRPSERTPVTLRMVRGAGAGEVVPVLILGAPLLGNMDPAEALFTLARPLVMLRPERVACSLPSGRAAVRIGFEAALLLGGLKPPSEALRADVERLTPQLEALLTKPARERLVVSVRRLVAKHGGVFPDVDRWFAGVELSALRASFLLVNDLVAAARSLAAEAAAGNAISAKLWLKDLVAFSISEPYFEARRALGLG
jgi:tetratricopeptide (TPR) repeat protein